MKQPLRLMLVVLSLIVAIGPVAPVSANLLLNPVVYAQTQPTCGGVFPVVADTSVYQGSPDLAYGDTRQLHVARDGGGAWHTLLQFDLADRIPRGATIHKAELQLSLDGAPQPLPYSLRVRNVSSTWDALTVTWSTQPTSSGRYSNLSSYVATGVLKLDVTALVTYWATDDSHLTSLILLPALDVMDVIFHSREAAVVDPPPAQLVIFCALPIETQPQDPSAADEQQMVDLIRLRQQSAQPLQLQLMRGVPRFAMFDLAVPPSISTDGLSRAQWFLNEYRGLLRLTDPTTQLQLKRRSGDDQHLFFRQRHQGIPVWPAGLAVHLEGGRVLAVSGNYLPEITLSPIPQLSAIQAERLALALGDLDTEVIGDTQLRYVNLGLLGAHDQRTYLAWQVNVGQIIARESLLIDANSGALILRRTYEATDFDLDLETAHNTGQSDTCWMFTYDDEQWFDEDGVYDGANPDAEGFQSFNNIKAVYNFWKNTFGRDSYDGDGEDIAMYIHVNPHPGSASYNGGCDIFEYGNGNTVLDVMGHEFSHAVDDSAGELEYAFESGALDESFADIFGHAMDLGDWLIGEETPQGTFRSMSNPPMFGQPDKYSDYQFLGDVHTNSGIHNKAAFLLTHGGTFNGRTVQGIGQAKAQMLFYLTLISWVDSYSYFIDARNGMVFYAFILYGPFSDEVCGVRNSYAAVEIGSGDADCDGIEDYDETDNDDDGLPDGNDNCPNNANPGQDDIDKDGMGNACDDDIDNDSIRDDADNCDYTPNPSQADFNSDGQGDACDDSDGDYIKDAIDNCRTTSNYDQKNSDFDNLGDACDPDRDGDGVVNSVDNCPDTPNPGQKDSDGDGWGDVCDLCPGVKSDDNSDTDGDGLGNPCDLDDDNDGFADTTDNCPLAENPDQIDLNQNGLGYACDEDEQAIFAIEDSYLFNSLLPLLLPVPDCIRCGDEYLPSDYEETITVELPVGFTARVIDSTGLTVAKSMLGTTKQTLSFQPTAYANQVAGTAGLVSQADPLQVDSMLAADDVNYRLYILPTEGVDPKQMYEVRVNITDTLSSSNQLSVFLPLVER